MENNVKGKEGSKLAINPIKSSYFFLYSTWENPVFQNFSSQYAMPMVGCTVHIVKHYPEWSELIMKSLSSTTTVPQVWWSMGTQKLSLRAHV